MKSKTFNKAAGAVLALVLATSTAGTLASPSMVYASGDSSFKEQLRKQTVKTTSLMGAGGEAVIQNEQLIKTADSTVPGTVGEAPLAPDGLPVSFDLRSKGVVTPVKNQLPWSSCWGFSTDAASEASILTSKKKTYKKWKLDLSERQLSWFAYTPIVKGSDGSKAQKGEGIYTTKKYKMDAGGVPLFSAMVYSAGIGPTFESKVPYRNNKKLVLTDTYNNPICYSTGGGWTVPEKYRFYSNFELKESLILPSPAQRDESDNYTGYKASANKAIKKQIRSGNPVIVCFHADNYSGTDPLNAKYINLTTYAHYTYDDIAANHAVTIVGWDDNYSKDNFLSGETDNGISKTPAGDGAWIVKNSWGSSDRNFPNYSTWGVNGTGYFYISYYDKSLRSFETFKYDTKYMSAKKKLNHVVNQHDYMPASGVNPIPLKHNIAMASVFKAPRKERIRSLSTLTAYNGTKVTYKLYKLKKRYKKPTDGKLIYKKTVTYNTAGYHKLNFSKKSALMKKGQKFSVVVTQKVGKYYVAMMNINLTKKGCQAFKDAGTDPGYYAKAVVNKKECYLQEKKKWTDWKSMYKYYSSVSDGKLTCDNFPIKAYGDPK
ncbi:MAG: C1 family peptidase [Eubacteriales bacterium]|nr:C1 family peptidase [Eubacteriales bacterium]